MKRLIGWLGMACVVTGCASAPMQTATLSSPWAPKPIFTITLHCPADVDPGIDAEGAWVDPATADLADADYECHSLLEYMQTGALALMPQARYERNR